MGGMSEGTVTWQDSSFRWKGQTRLENNGGFASLRSPWGEQDLRGLQRLEVTCRGTGGPFKVTLETSQRWWMPYAYATLDVSEEWQTIEVDVKDFQWSQAQMGDLRTVDPQSDFQNILRMGWMKYDGTAQAFDLEWGKCVGSSDHQRAQAHSKKNRRPSMGPYTREASNASLNGSPAPRMGDG